MDIQSKMNDAFARAQGGLFTAVEKADVGGSYQELERRGIALMGWADPFMPDRSMPDFVEKAWLDAVREDSAPHYTAPIGNPDLKVALARKLKNQNGLTVDPPAQHPHHAGVGLGAVFCGAALRQAGG